MPRKVRIIPPPREIVPLDILDDVSDVVAREEARMLASRHKPGPKPKEIDPKTVLRLARIGCTEEDIATVLGCSMDTLQRRFADLMEKGRAQCRMSLRHKQVQLALKGNRTMLVWLGKQLLGQKERWEGSSDPSNPLFPQVEQLSNDELRFRLTQLITITGSISNSGGVEATGTNQKVLQSLPRRRTIEA